MMMQMCEAIDNPTTGTDVFSRLSGAMNVYYNNSGTAKCFDPTNYGTDAIGVDAWNWQVNFRLLPIRKLIFCSTCTGTN